MTTKGETTMNANGKCEAVRQFARRGLALAALLAMVLFGAGVGRAQSIATAVPASAAKPTAVAAPLSAPSVAKPPSNTPHEGIKVHGHWTIEVRNPDGSLVKHVEFENSICPTQTVNGATVPGGALTLSQLATGQASIGSWFIILGDSTAVNTAPGVPPGCYSTDGSDGFAFQNAKVLIQSIEFSGNLEAYSNLCVLSCFSTLNAPPAPTPSNPTITLSGTIPAQGQSLGVYGTVPNQGGQISTVSTGNYFCPPGVSLTDCTNSFHQNPPAIITGTQLPSPGISYAAGQSVSVNVVIRFSSN
jgi:hypothetical protein